MANKIKIGGSASYVHFKWQNYQRYGITTKQSTSDVESAAEASYIAARNKLLKEIKDPKVALQEIQNQLNFFFPGSTQSKAIGNLTFTPDEIDQIQQLIIDKIISSNQKAFTFRKLQLSPNLDISYPIADISDDIAECFNNIASRIIKEKDDNGKSRFVQRKTIEQRMKALHNARQILEHTARKSDEDQLLNAINALESEWDAIQDTLSSSKEKAHVYFQKDGARIMNNYNFLKALEDTWIEYKRHNYAYFSGIVGEEYAALANEVKQAIAEGVCGSAITDIAKYINQLNVKSGDKMQWSKVQGFQRVHREISSDNVYLSKGSITANSDGGAHDVQGKVDLTIELNGISIASSIKNYNLTNTDHLSLHSGSNILYAVQDFSEFVGHYLNHTSEHPDQPSVAQIIDWNRKIKFLLTSFAFAGRAWEGAMPSVFIVNDSSSNQGYKVYSIKQLLNSLEDRMALVNFHNFDDTDFWNNAWVKIDALQTPSYAGAVVRVQKILGQMRKKQLKVSISKNALI